VVIGETGCQLDVINWKTGVVLGADITSLEGNMFRVRINEKNPMRQRYEVEGVLVGEPKTESCKVQRSSSGVEITSDSTRATVSFDPFRVDFHINNEIGVVLNSRGLMNFEHHRNKRNPPVTESNEDNNPQSEEEGGEDEGEGGEEGGNEPAVEEDEPVTPEPATEEDEPGSWEETFKTHTDSKPHGPSSVGMDISFPGVEHVYGIPEHADSLALKSTRSAITVVSLH